MSAPALEHPPPKHRRPGLTLYRYVAREALAPTLFGLVGLTVVVLTTSLLSFTDLVINRGVGPLMVARMLGYEAVPIVARMLPFAVLVGCMVGLGRMGAGREILALESCGVAAGRLVWPVVSYAGLMCAVALALSLEATPWAGRSFDEAYEQISRAKPWANLRAGNVQRFGGWQLEAREVSAGGDELQGVLLWMPRLGETIFARRGRLSTAENGDIEMGLREGAVLLPPERELRLMRFEHATVTLPQQTWQTPRLEQDRIPGLSLVALAELAANPDEPKDLVRRAALELHRRFAYPAATLIFGFLAVPLFVARGSFSRSSGGLTALTGVLVYYGLMQFGEGLVQAGVLSAALGAWLPNLLLGAVATVLLLRALREQVLGQSFDRSGARRFFPRRERAADAEPRVRSPRRYALPRYVAGRFVQMLALSFSVLFIAYLLIDVMDRLDWFARHGATGIEVLRFYGARVWLLASRAVPMAILVATSITVSLLAVEGELIGMRACGIPAPRALLPVLMIATLVAPLYFLLNNVVVPRTNALADELKRTEIKKESYEKLRQSQMAGFWYLSGSQLLEAGHFDPDRGEAQDITIFELDAEGLPTGRTDSARARHIGQGVWRLEDPSRVEIIDGRLERVPAPRHAQLGNTVEAQVDTMHLPVHEIAAEARAIERDGFDATPFWVDYHVRLAEPLACIVLPALVIFFAVSGPPFPGPAQTLLVSGIIGVSYILLVAVASSLGRGGALPPVASAWGPIALFALLGAGNGLRVWRRL